MNVGFIGLGTMGGPMAANLLKAGHSLTVHDIRLQAANQLLEGGAHWGDTPSAVAEKSAIIFTSLPGPPEMEAVALGTSGILEGARPDSVYIDLTTNSPSLLRRVHDIFREKGVHVLDAPVSGRVDESRSGKLRFLVGGDEVIVQRCKPVLDALSEAVIYTGSIGCGTICKLMSNCLHTCVQTAMAECFTLGVKAGVAPETLWEVIRRSSVGRMSFLHLGMPLTLFKGEFGPADDLPMFFHLKLGRKDIGLATQLGRDYDVPMTIANFCEQQLVEAVNRGWGEDNLFKFMTLQEERAGVQVRFSDIGSGDPP